MLHRQLGARMVEFSGYEMPLHYAGIMAEHKACRTGAALFDVSHMGQVAIADAAAFARVVPGNVTALRAGRQIYTLLLNESGGIIDDLMVANFGDRLVAVLNGGRKHVDVAHLRAHGVEVTPMFERALLALQGPHTARIFPEGNALKFMDAAELEVQGIAVTMTRSGYTGEDGFEIGCAAADAERLAQLLLTRGAVPAGLGARDSLRLEAGLCLYGNDIGEETGPVEAGITFSLSKKRLAAGDFIGAAAVNAALANGTARKLVGIRLDGRAPARAYAAIHADGEHVGEVTSGVFSPTLSAPIALGYVRADLAAHGSALDVIVRGNPLPATVSSLPFVPHNYAR
jgi:aminomethyltransferase